MKLMLRVKTEKVATFSDGPISYVVYRSFENASISAFRLSETLISSKSASS